jgi:hypothetical protein
MATHRLTYIGSQPMTVVVELGTRGPAPQSPRALCSSTPSVILCKLAIILRMVNGWGCAYVLVEWLAD